MSVSNLQLIKQKLMPHYIEKYYNSEVFKLYFIVYAITVVPGFSPLLPSAQFPPPLLQAISTPLYMSMGHAYMFFGYYIFHAVLYS